jgi:hypothetical protein
VNLSSLLELRISLRNTTRLTHDINPINSAHNCPSKGYECTFPQSPNEEDYGICCYSLSTASSFGFEGGYCFLDMVKNSCRTDCLNWSSRASGRAEAESWRRQFSVLSYRLSISQSKYCTSTAVRARLLSSVDWFLVISTVVATGTWLILV